ncbi:MAG: GGDEF domain-containing protein [Spirochaetes bacterium]|nr:GGDEF domain-containing protein [Spirochaetota bacterium]
MFETLSKKLNLYLDKIPKFILTSIFAIMISLSGFVEYYFNFNYSILFFSILLILYSSWYINKTSSIILSVLATLLLFNNDIHLLNNSLSADLINNFIRLILFISLSLIINEVKNKFHMIKNLAKTDFLTGILNPRAFYESAKIELKRSDRYKQPLTLIYLDIDNFKSINDSYGHLKGDTVLNSVANVLKDNTRLTDIVARVGGDEFALLLPYTGYDAAGIFIEKIKGALCAKMSKEIFMVTYSIGAVTYSDIFPQTVTQMMNEADEVMYSVKKESKDSIKHLNMNLHEIPYSKVKVFN